MNAVRCTIMRGGTSRGVFLRYEDLPESPKERDEAIMKIFGSGDPFQIDGLGGSTQYTSKVMLVGRAPQGREFDIVYEFGQVGIADKFIDWNGNDGNLTAALGPYAIEEKLVEPRNGITPVRAYNKKTKKIVEIDVPVSKGEPVYGDSRTNEVSGREVQVICKWLEPGGSVLSKGLFPTGCKINRINIRGKEVEITVVDSGSIVVLVNSKDVNLAGTELPGQETSGVSEVLEEIRRKGAELAGMLTSPLFPLVAFISRPADYTTSTGFKISHSDYDLSVRIFSMGEIHHALSITGAIAIASAAFIRGTVASKLATKRSNIITLGHPKGLLSLRVQMGMNEGKEYVDQVIVSRTCRLIMKGLAYY